MVNNNIYYIIYLVLFFIAQCSSMWGQFFILKYKDITLWDAYKMAIPFAWFAWLLMTYVVYIGDEYELVTSETNMLLFITFQYIIISVINDRFLKEPTGLSDIIAFFIILIGYFISYYRIISRIIKYLFNSELDIAINDEIIQHKIDSYNSKNMTIKEHV
jgi:hypothetical protein